MLMSETKQGLQNSLNVISNYCNVWKLILMSQSPMLLFLTPMVDHNTNEFKFNSNVLQTVPRYFYLGVMEILMLCQYREGLK